MPVYLSLPLQWYKKHRGLASGVAASGSGFGGGLCAITVRKLLPILGYRYTMLVRYVLTFTPINSDMVC